MTSKLTRAGPEVSLVGPTLKLGRDVSDTDSVISGPREIANAPNLSRVAPNESVYGTAGPTESICGQPATPHPFRVRRGPMGRRRVSTRLAGASAYAMV